MWFKLPFLKTCYLCYFMLQCFLFIVLLYRRVRNFFFHYFYSLFNFIHIHPSKQCILDISLLTCFYISSYCMFFTYDTFLTLYRTQNIDFNKLDTSIYKRLSALEGSLFVIFNLLYSNFNLFINYFHNNKN